MMELLTLVKANLKHKKGGFLSILILMLIISTVLTSVLSIQKNMDTRIYDAHDAVGTGDLVIFMEHKELTEDMLTKIKDCKNVEKVTTIPYMLMKQASVNGKTGPVNTFIRSYKDNDVHYPLFNKKGNAFETEEKSLQENDVLLPISMRDTYSCDIGDSVVLDIGTEKISLVIRGFIEEPLCGSNVMNVKELIVSEKMYSHIHDVSHIEEQPENEYIWNCSMINIFKSSTYTGTVEDFSKEVNAASNVVSLGYTSITKEQSVSYTLLVTNIICGVLQAFVILLLVVVILVLSNSINSSIEMDYTNIGILKSQGFTKMQIRLVLLVQYLLSGVLGSLFGILISIPVVRVLRNVFIPTSGLLFSSNICWLKITGIQMLILLVIGLFILSKTRKIAKISPVNAIMGGLDDVYFKSMMQTPVVGKSKRFLSLKLAFRQLTTNTKWYLGTCFIIALLASFVCMTASYSETFTETYYKEMFGIKISDVRVEGDDFDSIQKEVEATIESITPIEKSFYYDYYYILMDDEQIEAQVLSDASYLTTILEGRAPKYDNEVAITNLVSKRLGKKIGDKVTLNCKGNKKEYMITGFYDSCSDIGRCFAITLEGISRVCQDYICDCHDYFLQDPSKVNEVIKAVNEQYQDQYKVTAKIPTAMDQKSIDAIMTTSNLVMLSLVSISIFFAIIVILLISNKMYLRERQMLGIYKAFGFTTTSLRFQYCFRFVLVAILGCAIGGVLFVLFGNTLNASVLSLAGISSYYAPVTWFNLGLPILLICVTVFLSSYISMRKVKKVDVKSLIVE